MVYGGDAEQIVEPEREQQASHRETFVLTNFRARPVNFTVMLLRLSLTMTLLATASCARPQVVSQQLNTTPSPIGTPSIQPTPSPAPVSPIHKIDFDNFTYPAAPVYPKNERSFTLKDGEFVGRLQPGGAEPESVSRVDTIYGDVTADGVDDAIVVLTESIHGSAIPYYVYVYGLERDKPKLLWSFYAGERGDGGLRQIVADRGDMVIELYGRDRVVTGGTSSDEDNMGVCCPRFFTRSRYEWRDGHFRLKTKEAALPNPQGNAAYLALDK